MRTRPTTIALLAAGALTIAACSSGDPSPSAEDSDNPYAEPIATVLAAEPDTPLTAEQTDCIAGSFAEAVGTEPFEAAGVEPADVEAASGLAQLEVDFTEEHVDAFDDALEVCDMDIKALVIEQFEANEEVPAGFVECIEETVPGEELSDLFAQSFVTGADDDEALFEVLGSCIEQASGS